MPYFVTENLVLNEETVSDMNSVTILLPYWCLHMHIVRVRQHCTVRQMSIWENRSFRELIWLALLTNYSRDEVGPEDRLTKLPLHSIGFITHLFLPLFSGISIGFLRPEGMPRVKRKGQA